MPKRSLSKRDQKSHRIHFRDVLVDEVIHFLGDFHFLLSHFFAFFVHVLEKIQLKKNPL